MERKRFDLSRPTGIVGLNILVLSIVTFAFGIVFSILNYLAAGGAGNYWISGDWSHSMLFSFIESFIGLAISLIFLYMNYREVQKKDTVPDWIISRQKPRLYHPPLCSKFRETMRYSMEKSGWCCDACNISPNIF